MKLLHTVACAAAAFGARWPARRIAACALVACAWTGAACAQTIAEARYDRARDELVVRILYRGTSDDHGFTLAWDPCMSVEGRGAPHQTAARIIDRQGDDAAMRDFDVTRRFALSGLACRPARVTLRLGPRSTATVYVPDANG
jgi:hypothetical protein